MGDRPIASITAPEMLSVLRRIEGRGVSDVSAQHRVSLWLDSGVSCYAPRQKGARMLTLPASRIV